MAGPSNRQKIAKIFKDDEEIALDMLKRQRRKGINWKRIFHFFGIHDYAKLIKQNGKDKVVKCAECDKLYCTPCSWGWGTPFLVLFSLLLGIAFGPAGIYVFLLNMTNLWSLVWGILGMAGIYASIKTLIQRLWMGF